LDACFGEEYNKTMKNELQILNTNKMSHRKKFVNNFEELLHVFIIEMELNYVER